jgi:hypothetical protein
LASHHGSPATALILLGPSEVCKVSRGIGNGCLSLRRRNDLCHGHQLPPKVGAPQQIAFAGGSLRMKRQRRAPIFMSAVAYFLSGADSSVDMAEHMRLKGADECTMDTLRKNRCPRKLARPEMRTKTMGFRKCVWCEGWPRSWWGYGWAAARPVRTCRHLDGGPRPLADWPLRLSPRSLGRARTDS